MIVSAAKCIPRGAFFAFFICGYYSTVSGTEDHVLETFIETPYEKSHLWEDHSSHERQRRSSVIARSLNVPSYYSACEHKSHNCFPRKNMPCFAERNCPYLVRWKVQPSHVQFEILTDFLEDKATGEPCSNSSSVSWQYLAFGISVGKDSRVAVVECAVTGSKDSGNSRQAAGVSGANPMERILLASSTHDEYERIKNFVCNESTEIGKLTHCDIKATKRSMLCEFEIKRRFVLEHEIYNLYDTQQIIHLASGCDVQDMKHSITGGGRYITSDTLVRFYSYKKHEHDTFRSDLALWHGTIMIVVWCVLVPNGVYVSRYLKESFVEVSIFKYRLWFAGHTFIMILALLLCIGAISTILHNRLEVEFAWPTEKSSKLHFNLGFAALLMFAIQVAIGGLRCHGRKLRRCFSTFHLFVGLASYIVSRFTGVSLILCFIVVCISFSDPLGKTCNLKVHVMTSGLWTLIGHVAMSVHYYYIDKQLGLYIYRAFYPFPLPPVTYDELPGRKVRSSIMLAHFIGCLLISGVMLWDYVAGETCE